MDNVYQLDQIRLEQRRAAAALAAAERSNMRGGMNPRRLFVEEVDNNYVVLLGNQLDRMDINH